MGAPTGPFRPLKEMMYPVIGAPWVQSLLTVSLARFLFGDATVASWGFNGALRFTTAAWLASAFHGIVLDYTVFRISWRVVLSWWAGSFAAAVATAYAISVVM